MVKKRSGEATMALAVLLGLVAVLVPPNHLTNGAGANGIASSFIRVLCQGIVVVPLLALHLARSKDRDRALIYDLRSLVQWAIAGAATVLLYFLSIERVGYGAASVLSSSSGILAFAIDKFQRRDSSKLGTLSILCAMGGFLLLGAGQMSNAHSALGWVFGLGSGLTACFAYLSLSRSPVRNSSICVLSSWFLAALVVHLLFMTKTPASYPSSSAGWIYPVGFGLLTTAIQWLTSQAFQIGPPGRIALIANFSAPTVYVCEWAFAGRSPSMIEWSALGLITIGSCARSSSPT